MIPSLPSVRPCAATVHAHLKRTGLHAAVERVTSGRRRTAVHLKWDGDPQVRETTAHRVAEALRQLWHDGDRRVQIWCSGLVTIDREGYYRTVPHTPEGLAALARHNAERNEALRAAQAQGRQLITSSFACVEWAPAEGDPHHPWRDVHGDRFTPDEVFLL